MVSFRSTAAVLAACAATAVAHENGRVASCGNDVIPERVQTRVEELTLNFVRNVCQKTKTPELIPFCGVKGAAPIISEVPIAFHILHYEDGRNNITQARIDQSMEILNNDFAGRGQYTNTNFQFKLRSVDRWANDLWASTALASGGGISGTPAVPNCPSPEYPNCPEEFGYKPIIGVDQATTMNIYVGEMRGGVLGMCPFPFFGKPDSNVHGCVVHPGAVVGDVEFGFDGYNEGGTLTHEVGHGVGLWHVWQGGCRRNGDMVEDTNPQETNSRGCPTNPIPDSCGDGLPDNIHNHMDYSDDSCRFEFTIGQSDRADMVVAAWHPGYLNPIIQDAIRAADPNAWDDVLSYQSVYQIEEYESLVRQFTEKE